MPLSTEDLEAPKVEVPADEPTEIEMLSPEWDPPPADGRSVSSCERYEYWSSRHNPLYLPTVPRLLTLNEDGYDDFASSTRIGYAKDVDHVAGFGGHAVVRLLVVNVDETRDDYAQTAENSPMKEPTHFWQIRRMNLVSLLKFPQPAVYESENVPTMQELVKAKTRPLDKFEADALQKLRDGEQIVVASQTNRIQMLGSLRATKRCLDCHSVQHGELLGAFSYELIRAKPISIARNEKAAGG